MAEQMPPTVTEATFAFQLTEDEIVIGDKQSDKFEPLAKLKRWGEECFIKVAYPTKKKISPVVEKEAEIIKKIKWIDINKELHFYPTKVGNTDAFEFEIILKEKPANNKIVLNIETQGLQYYYQPSLIECEIPPEGGSVSETEVKDKDGNVILHRPENVVGSYAIYHESKQGDYSKIGGKNYMAGKAFHIYRPKITDAKGNWIWGELNILDGFLSITINRNWLNNAVYPVIIDPTFGYETQGGSSSGLSNKIRASKFPCPEAGIGNSISGWVQNINYEAAEVVKFALYNSALNKVGETTEVSVASGFNDKKTINFVANPGLTATNYWIAAWSDTTNMLLRSDSGAANQGLYGVVTYGSWPASLTPDSYFATKYSIYCTYTPTAGQPIMARLHGIPGMNYTGRAGVGW